jgi:hypothetical protein
MLLKNGLVQLGSWAVRITRGRCETRDSPSREQTKNADSISVFCGRQRWKNGSIQACPHLCTGVDGVRTFFQSEPGITIPKLRSIDEFVA